MKRRRKLKSIRKHVSQMTAQEKSYLHNEVLDIKYWKFKEHALDMLQERGIVATLQDLITTVQYGEILEYHRLGREDRVLFRGKALVNGDSNLNVVVSITTCEIVTTWLNRTNDRHKSLDFSIYNKELVIV